MRTLKKLFDNNRRWAERTLESEPSFFHELAKQQTPPYLWLGCADSRVPANQIVDLPPGQVFVHRNIANLFNHTDFSALSVLQYAVQVLEVSDVIVCGHYGCGGVAAALGNSSHGLIDNWLRHIKDVYDRSELPKMTDLDPRERVNRMCEINVAAQVDNVCRTSIVQEAWARGQTLNIHGWIYSLEDGLLKDLDCCISGPDSLSDIYRISK